MMFPYAEFLLSFDNKHGSMTHRNAPENTRAAVIIETRPFFFLPKVIRNTMFFLNQRWNLYVFCGELSYDYVSAALQGWAVHIIKIPGLYRLSTSDYNKFLTDPNFWRRFKEEKLLIFQADSILTSADIDAFMDYDYVGAPCGRFDAQYIANGGLSLRTRQVMIECTTKFRPSEAVAEDVFFTQAIRSIGATMPNLDTATRFAVESVYTTHPVGVHGTDKCYHPIEVAQKIVSAIQY